MLEKQLNHSLNRIKSAQAVLFQESHAIKLMADQLNEKEFSKNFIKTLHLLEEVQKKGKLIVTGVGKSGHVGKKMAATFASMGTPSFFVHPSEASHGDLGMITKNDVVMALSNSGESKELFDLLNYCNKNKIPLIGVCRVANSTLAKKADVPLIMVNVPEACPIGKAPTVSTTMTLALGDAIAIVMAERWGLNPEAYKQWHPGGKLGSSLIKAKSLTDKNVKLIKIKENETLENLLKTYQKTPGVIVIENDKKEVIGTVTNQDLLIKKVNKVSEIITKIPTISEEAPAYEAHTALSDSATDFCFVIDSKNRLVGITNSKSILKQGQ